MIAFEHSSGIQSVLVWLRQVRVMTLKELRHLFEDRALLGIIIYIFTLQIFIAAGEVSTDLKNARLLVQDNDRTSASRELIYKFQSPYFSFAGDLANANEGLRMLDTGKASLLLDIPHDFLKNLDGGLQPAPLQLLIDTSKVNIGYLASFYSLRIAADFSREWASKNLLRAGFDLRELPRIQEESRIWFNPDLDEAWFGTIAELMGMITVACILLPAASMVREKERGTIEQLLVSPLSPFQVMISKILSMVFVTLVGTAISLFIIMQGFYSVPVRGSVFLFFSLTALYSFTNAGLGLAAASFARTSGQIGMIVLFIVLPIINLSGTRTPVESMPLWLQHLIQLFPMRHFVEITYGILLKGTGLRTIFDSVLIMVLLGSVLFAIGLWRFRRQFE